MGEWLLTSPRSVGLLRQFVRWRRGSLPTLQTGGFCVVASAFACVDFFFDFVALRGRIGADGAFTGAAVASSIGRTARRRRAGTFALYGWRGAAGDRPGFGTGTRRAGAQLPTIRVTAPKTKPAQAKPTRRQGRRRRRRRPGPQHLTRPALPTLPAERPRCRNWRAR